MMMDLIILVFAAFTNVALGMLIMIRNPRQKQAQAFLVTSITVTLWAIANYFTDHAPTVMLNDTFARLALLFAFLTVAAVYSFTQNLNEARIGIRNVFLWPIIISGGLFSLSNYVLKGVVHYTSRTDVVPGELNGLYILLVVSLFILGLRNLRTKFIDAGRDSRLRVQIKYISLGLSVSFVLILFTNGLLPILFNNWSIAKVGPLMTVFLIGSIGYAIARHRLFDMRLVVARSVAYALLLTTLATSYAAALFGTSRLLSPHQLTSSAQTTLSISIAIILAFTFQPLQRFFQKWTDRVFYRDRYDSHEVISAIGKVMVEEFELEPLLNKTLSIICRSMRVEMGQFMIFEKNRIYKVEHFGPLPRKLMVVPTMAKLHHPLLVADELTGGQRKQILDEHGVRTSLMLRTRDTFVGFLFLGDKLNGNIYTDQDLKLLKILVQELSIAILNAKAYAEISQFNITLQQRVSSAMSKLRVANQNLKALDSAKDEFISMVSHQLRTPLTTIKGYLSMMLDGDTGKITGEQKEFLGFAYEGAERMVALISDLLNVSRLAAGRFVIEKKPTDLVNVVADEVRQLRRHAEAKNLELIFTPPSRKMPLMELDESKTRQVIMNFIDNAIYYTRQGGIYINLNADKQNVRLTVRDTGIGVPESAKSQLFSKFFRAENAQAARPDGTGLGLFLAKQVVEDQGGTVIFESTQDQGSTFGFSMPIRMAAKAPQKTKNSLASNAGKINLKHANTLTKDKTTPGLQVKRPVRLG
jgi:signal transduction histidine kinase